MKTITAFVVYVVLYLVIFLSVLTLLVLFASSARCQVKATPTQVLLTLQAHKYENVIIRNDTRDTLTLSVIVDQTRLRVSHMPSVMPYSWSPVTITCDSTQHESFSEVIVLCAGDNRIAVTVHAEGVSGVSESAIKPTGARGQSHPTTPLFDLLGRPVKGAHARQQLFEWRKRHKS